MTTQEERGIGMVSFSFPVSRGFTAFRIAAGPRSWQLRSHHRRKRIVGPTFFRTLAIFFSWVIPTARKSITFEWAHLTHQTRRFFLEQSRGSYSRHQGICSMSIKEHWWPFLSTLTR